MARYISDQTKIGLFYESGLYAVASGAMQWMGYVDSFDIVEKQNIIQTRYLGQLNRNVGRFDFGPYDVEGKVSFLPQDFRMFGMAIGSVTTTSGTAQTGNYKLDMSEVNTDVRGNAFTSGTMNPFVSFTVEEARISATANQNSKRTIKGCVVDEYSLEITQSNPVKVDISFIGQIGSWHSGAASAMTAGSNRPYLWSDTTIALAGTTQETAKKVSFTLKNNFVGPHYVNGSRVIAVPYPLNRDYSIAVTQDFEATTAQTLYDNYFVGGSLFNSSIDMNNTFDTGSHHMTMYFSGCKMINMTIPAKLSNIVEVSYTFVPGSVNAIAHDRGIYTAW